jgi:hypothetical protein
MLHIKFIYSKIKRYGIFGIFKYTYIKYSAEIFSKTFLGKLKKVKGKNFVINFSRNNVAKALYLFPNLHDGDVLEIERMFKEIESKSNKKANLLFVDVGANVGTVSIPIAKFLKNLKELLKKIIIKTN